MDSSIPSSQRSNFMDLLNSQADTPLFSYSQSVAGTSEPPVFSPQCSDVPTLNTRARADRVERKRWKPFEDIVLISSWLNTSKDATVSTDQKLGAFWKRVAELYGASPKVQGYEKRDSGCCQQRWRKISTGVSKFCGSYEAAVGTYKSGFNPGDEVQLAHQIYHSDHGKKFLLEHAWQVMRFEQKWCAISESKSVGSSKKRKCGEGSTQSESIHSVNNVEPDIMARPPGVKAVKAKAKAAAVNASKSAQHEAKKEDFQNLCQLREKDNAFKERNSNKKLLAKLVANAGTLTDEEVVLKQLIVADLLAQQQGTQGRAEDD